MIHRPCRKDLTIALRSICFILAIHFTTPSNAQTLQRPVLCGNEVFTDILHSRYPALHDAFDQTFHLASRASVQRGNDPLTIPVVVHVVWKEGSENLHDSIILNQIEILNQDFNRLNPDTGNLRPLFSPVAASANIHFELASIVRVQSDQLFSVELLGTNLLPEVKHNALGGSDAWNTEQYLNIWICNIQPIEIFGLVIGQILGFSFPPNNLPNWPENVGAPQPDEDGVVVDYRVIGSNNPNGLENPVDMSPLVVKGRTPVHEVGHYLGLRHIWGDGGLLGPNDCAQSDGIEDTPFANAESHFDCDTSKNTCEQLEPFYNSDMPDLIENYMDYASEECMNMFTQGQVDLMRNVILGPRIGLIEGPLSTKSQNAHPECNVYPNPATDHVVCRIEHAADTHIALRLLNLGGQVLMQKEEFLSTDDQEIELSTAGMAPGLYIVQVASGQNMLWDKMVIR